MRLETIVSIEFINQSVFSSSSKHKVILATETIINKKLVRNINKLYRYVPKNLVQLERKKKTQFRTTTSTTLPDGFDFWKLFESWTAINACVDARSRETTDVRIDLRLEISEYFWLSTVGNVGCFICKIPLLQQRRLGYSKFIAVLMLKLQSR